MTRSMRFAVLSVAKLLSIGCLLAGFNCNLVQAAPISAIPVTLAWDASPDPAVVGYALYYGVVNSSTTNRLDLGTTTSVTVTNLYAGSNYFFFVAAFNAFGMESVPSNMLLYRPPALSRLRLTRLADGTMSIRFRSAPGSLCRVEYASTPGATQWQTLANSIANANGYVAVSDPPAGRPPSRFYRALRP
jgi:hypothetical protein